MFGVFRKGAIRDGYLLGRINFFEMGRNMFNAVFQSRE